jgi:hypothetical protein
MTKDVFISHSSKDSKVAHDICTLLEEREKSECDQVERGKKTVTPLAQSLLWTSGF